MHRRHRRGTAGGIVMEIWVVLDEGNQPIYSASYPEACHEHINDAINEFAIDEAARWKVVCFVKKEGS